MTENKYIGSSCDCINLDSYEDCDHGATISDTYLLLKFFEFINTNESIVQKSKAYKEIQKLDSDELQRQVTECDHIDMSAHA